MYCNKDVHVEHSLYNVKEKDWCLASQSHLSRSTDLLLLCPVQQLLALGSSVVSNFVFRPRNYHCGFLRWIIKRMDRVLPTDGSTALALGPCQACFTISSEAFSPCLYSNNAPAIRFSRCSNKLKVKTTGSDWIWMSHPDKRRRPQRAAHDALSPSSLQLILMGVQYEL